MLFRISLQNSFRQILNHHQLVRDCKQQILHTRHSHKILKHLCTLKQNHEQITRDAVCGENLLKISARPASILASENTLAIKIELGVLWHCLEEHPDVVITSKSILDIVKIKPGIEGRSYGDSMYLAGWLRQLRFFRQLPPNVLIMCSKHAYLKRYSNGTVIDEHHGTLMSSNFC